MKSMNKWLVSGATVLSFALPLQAQLWVDIHAAAPPPPRPVVIEVDHYNDHYEPAPVVVVHEYRGFNEWENFERTRDDEDYFHRLGPRLIDKTDHWVDQILHLMGRDNTERENLHREQLIFMSDLPHVQHLLDDNRPHEAEVELVNAEADLLAHTTFDREAQRDIDHLRADRLDDADHADRH